MKIRNIIFFALIGVILSGATTAVFISVLDKQETVRLFDQTQTEIPERYAAASMSEGNIILLLALGVIGVLGVSRKKKDTGDPAPKKETTKSPSHRNLDE